MILRVQSFGAASTAAGFRGMEIYDGAGLLILVCMMGKFALEPLSDPRMWQLSLRLADFVTVAVLQASLWRSTCNFYLVRIWSYSTTWQWTSHLNTQNFTVCERQDFLFCSVSSTILDRQVESGSVCTVTLTSFCVWRWTNHARNRPTCSTAWER